MSGTAPATARPASVTAEAQVVANLLAWLDGLRPPAEAGGQPGYGGPVVHWWQNCLSFTGAGLDWRYEGIVDGYLTLWRHTGDPRWLERARRAGDDLGAGQLPGGNFRHSCFELNPGSGGTPHEAAVDLALLGLAGALRDAVDDGWRHYAGAARRNLRRYFIDRLWDETAGRFRDRPGQRSFVPNKVCTLAEALFACAELEGDDALIVRHALPTLEAVLALQQAAPARLAGAIAQNVWQGEVVPHYYPTYIARCVPALVKAADHTGHERWLAAATAALAFVRRQMDDDGLLPQVVYARGAGRHPRWLAGLGDVLRAADLLAARGAPFDFGPMRAALLGSQLPTGGFRSARDFARQLAGSTRPGLPDCRDHVPAAGWNDKAFRYLARQVPAGRPLPPALLGVHEADCQVDGRAATWRETATEMTLRRGGALLYRYRKGRMWADVVAPELMWK